MARDLIEPGNYVGVATRVAGEDGDPIVRFSFAGKNRTQQSLVYFKIVEGPEAGVVVPWFGFWTPDAGRRTAEAFRYMGAVGDDPIAWKQQPLDQKVELVVGHNEWDGKTHARVDFVNQIGGGAIKLKAPMQHEDEILFATRVRASLSKIPPVAGERFDASSIPTRSASSRRAPDAGGGAGWTAETTADAAPPRTDGWVGRPPDDDIPF